MQPTRKGSSTSLQRGVKTYLPPRTVFRHQHQPTLFSKVRECAKKIILFSFGASRFASACWVVCTLGAHAQIGAYVLGYVANSELTCCDIPNTASHRYGGIGGCRGYLPIMVAVDCQSQYAPITCACQHRGQWKSANPSPRDLFAP